MEWQENNSQLHAFIKNVRATSPKISSPRPARLMLNHLRTGIGLFCSKTHKWGVASTAACECGTIEQTAEHVITSFPIYHNPNGARALSDVDKSLMIWLIETYRPFIVPSSSRPSPLNLPSSISHK